MMAVKDDLIAARKLIEKPDHWCKGRMRNGSAMCAAGAIAKAVGHDPFLAWNKGSRPRLAKDVLDAAVPRVSMPAVCFNDLESTTHNDILALFDRAIQAAEA